MWTRILAATVAGGIAIFILGFVIYGLILDPLVMKPNMTPEAARLMKDPPSWLPLILGNFVLAFLLSYVFDQWATIRTFIGGLRGGAILLFLITLYFQLMFMAFMNVSHGTAPLIADIVGSIVLGGLSGGVIGFVLGKMDKR